MGTFSVVCEEAHKSEQAICLQHIVMVAKS